MTLKEKLAYASAIATVTAAFWSAITYGIEYEQSLVKKPEMDKMMLQQQSSMNEIKRDNFESKIFEIGLIERPTRAQQALKNYYQQKLDAMNKGAR